MAAQQLQRKECSDVFQVQLGTRATMNNQTSNVMQLDRSINWFGSPSTEYPATITNHHNAKFLHVRDGEFGSMGAVQYSGPKAPNGQGSETAYILAWQTPGDLGPNSPNRVYVDCGTKYRLDNISWDQVLLNLEEGLPDSFARDDYSKTIADATINNSSEYATLIANFNFTD